MKSLILSSAFRPTGLNLKSQSKFEMCVWLSAKGKTKAQF